MHLRHGSRSLLILLPLLAAGCGGQRQDATEPGSPPSQLRAELQQAQQVTAADFPAVQGRSLQQVANRLTAGPQVGLASSVFVPGTNRLGFGVIDQQGRFLYGKTAVYFARHPDDRAQGPFPAPADSLITQGRYRSRNAASETDPFAAIYAAFVDFKRPGRYAVLTVTKSGGRLLGATAQVKVKPRSADSVPEVGQPAPAAPTDTVTSARGDLRAIDTRVPPDDMHDTSLTDVLGKKPVALLFATPQLCQSRVCGPVVDIAQQLKAKYGDRMTFIHQEVYVDNDPKKGLRAPLRRYGLESEPWLFTIDRQGGVAARLEGSFGFAAFDRAIRAAL